MADRARLDSERAEILAESKRLELNRFKEKNVQPTAEEKEEPPKAYDISPRKLSPAIPPTGQDIAILAGVDFPRVDEKDIAIIKDKICGMKTFFVTEVDRSPFSERVVFRGNLRIDPENALEELDALAVKYGIDSRVRLFFLQDPRDVSSESKKKPVLVALPADVMPNKPSLISNALCAVTALLAYGTTLAYGVGIFGVTPGFMEGIADGNLDGLYKTLPVSTGIALLALIHEAGHRVLGEMRDVKLGIPNCIPSLQIGTYGTITPLESYPRMRADLFDVAAAGPLAGLTSSVLAFCVGLLLTTQSGGVGDGFPVIPSSLLHTSAFIGVITDAILTPAITQQAAIAVHPLTVVGYTGIFVNALNLFPVGRLDGGRMTQALFGRDTANRISGVTLFLQGLSALFGNSPLLLFWGLVCVFLQREADSPSRNEIVEPNELRSVLGILLLLVPLLVFLPLPGNLGA